MLGFFKQREVNPSERSLHRTRSSDELVRRQTSSLHDYSYEAVLARIEVSFGALESGKISAATFEKIVLAERDTLLALANTVQMPWTELGDEHPQLEIFDVASSDRKDALALIEHCLAWAQGY